MTGQFGRYKVLEQIGEGGFAVVHRARDTALERDVALKALKPILLRDGGWVKRFRREARVIARLDHPQIIPIYDVGDADDQLYIVMRLVNGPSLAELMAQQGHLSWTETVEIIAAIAHGLDHAHSQAILHRDLKPANILLDPERGPLLTDFGMAKIAGDAGLSATGDIVGTPHYIAPETWEAQPATPQADIFALGCILFEMLVGEKVFPGDTPLAVMNAHLRGVALPQTWPEGVPPGVAEVLSIALAKEPTQRFATATQLADELARLTKSTVGTTPPADRLEVFTFGGLRLHHNGEPVSNVGSKRVEALLAYLASTGRPHPREVLADLLWDDRPQQQAMSNLRTVLSGLRKHFGPFVTITRDSVGLDPTASIWVDTETLTEVLASGAVEDADELYQGIFLEGFYLRGAQTFEDWLSLERENWQRQVQDALSQAVADHLARNDYQAGIPVARRLLQLDPLLEEAHRNLMRLLAASGQRSAALTQYETCRQILDEELGVEPATETTALYEQIQSGTLEQPGAQPAAGQQPPKLPAFLHESVEAPQIERPLFVARQTELARLNDHLAATLQGNGRVVLITGEAGRGKTSLLTEFAHRAQAAHPALIVAWGICNAYSGLGDPYLPFRELMSFLTADVDARWAAGTMSREYARRLWQVMPHTAHALVERGPSLIELFVAGEPFAGRLAALGPAGQPWSERIAALAEQAKTGAGSLEQGQVFEQVGQVLQTLAQQQPLLLILDDLQWADSASVSLLFHLARRLTGQPILIVGTYRPLELEVDSDSSHPFAAVAGEIKRLFGDIELDLGHTPSAEGRAFVDALLDSEPNTLGESFRESMFRQTQGHPLFTVELLREMQERGDLIQDEDGRWTETEHLDWGELPARVEAVIEQRLNRLDDDTQEMLTIAAVEGEIFTVQVIARLHDISERKLLRQLSRALGKQHRLVSEQSEVRVGEQVLSRFQFRHALFQQYLYNQLSAGERRLLHTDVAAVLEELYAGHTEEISVALARHYTEAGQGEKATPHLLHAGDQAWLTYAHEAAIEHYRQAVIFLKEQGDDGHTADTLMKLGLTYHNAFQFEQSRLAYEEAFAMRPQAEHAARSTPPQSTRPLRLAIGTDQITLDPAFSSFTEDSIVINQLFNGLVGESPKMEVMPEVAQSWDVLEKGKKYIFRLRDDVRWSDGVPVTAKDFEFAWKRILSPATESPNASLLYDIKGAEEFHQGKTDNSGDVSIYAFNQFTLMVELNHPASYFLQLLTHSSTFPVPTHIVERYGHNWTSAENIVSNGPFKLDNQFSNESFSLVRNPTYFGQFKGNVKQVNISLHKTGASILEMYSRDEVDIASTGMLSSAEMDVIRQKHPEEHIFLPETMTIYLGFNTEQTPFDDPNIRRAFILATDREKWANETENGFGSPATGGFIPPGIPGHSAEIGWPFDPERARQLLTQAGYPQGRGFPEVELLAPDVSRAILQCRHLQTQWQENLGITIAWKTLNLNEFVETLRKGLYHTFILGWSADYPDPDNFLRVGTQYVSNRWHNKSYDQLLEKAGQVLDQRARLKVYRQADKILAEDAALMPLYYDGIRVMVKPWVKNLSASPREKHLWKDIIINLAGQPARTQPVPESPTERTLRIAVWEPSSLDPTLFDDLNFYNQLFRGLVATTLDSGIAPDVAERWEILEGGRKYIFRLRPDVRWSDGAPLTAADFEFAWKRALNPATASPLASLLYDIKNGRAFHQGQLPDAGQVGVQALDAVTLVVELEEPTGYFLHLLGSNIACPVPRHLVERHGAAWINAELIATNGPFRVERWISGQSAVLRRNPYYHGQFSGNLDRVELTISHWDTNASLKQYEADELDVVLVLFPSEEMDQARRRHAEDFTTAPALNTTMIGFNLNRPPFDDVRVRQALALAFDKQTLVNTMANGHALPADGGFIPNGMPGFSPEIGLPFDPDLARQRLAEAGFPGGRGFPAVDWWVLNWEAFAEYLRAQWRDVLGINLPRAQVETTATITDRLAEADASFYLAGWAADFPDPANFLGNAAAYHGATWQHKEYTRLVEAAARTTNQETRLSLYQQADQILVNEALVIPMTYGQMHLLIKPWVKKYPVSATNYWFWQDVIVEAK